MRMLKTFLIHLYTDTEAVDRICGDIHPLDDKKSYSFKNGIEFVNLLHQLLGKSGSPETANHLHEVQKKD